MNEITQDYNTSSDSNSGTSTDTGLLGDFSDIQNWRSWEEMDLPINETDLKSLAKCFKNGFHSGESFVLRDQIKKAHSASYKIKNIKWVDKTQEFFVTIYRQGKF